MTTKQLALDLRIRPTPSLDNFVVGDNGDLIAALKGIESGQSGTQFLYMWGRPGVGRSHLLQAMDPLYGVERVPEYSGLRHIYTVDDIDGLDSEGEQRLFDLMNEVRFCPRGSALITAGRQAPSRMAGRGDIISRLSWGLVFQVKPLTDDHKDAALRELAVESRISLPEDARRWMMEHLPRDMGALADALFTAERESVESSRKITRALLRQCFPE